MGSGWVGGSFGGGTPEAGDADNPAEVAGSRTTAVDNLHLMNLLQLDWLLHLPYDDVFALKWLIFDPLESRKQIQ